MHRSTLLPVLCLFLGCGTQGPGCGALAPLPPAPLPTGFPAEQLIEGGMQVRITRPGLDKLTSLIPSLVRTQLHKPFCVPPADQDLIGIAHVKECTAACGGGTGCPLSVSLPDNGIQITLPDGNLPTLDVSATFDVSLPVHVTINFFGIGDVRVADFQVSAPQTRLSASVGIGIDPASGHVHADLSTLHLDHLDLHIGGCGFLQAICDAIDGYVSGQARDLVSGFLVGTVQPQLDTLIQGYLPRPPGVAGVVDLATSLQALHLPQSAALELYLVAGGYASAYNGGLNLGVLSGVNSDAHPETRGPGQTSDPAECVPARSAPILGGPPWDLPPLPSRRDFVLRPAGAFTGLPDPVDDKGHPQDLAIGVSRTFLDLLGFHVYNAGMLCASLQGDAIPQLSAGSLVLLLPSLQDLLDPGGYSGGRAPLALSLRPQVPLRFTLGSGTGKDALLHARVADLRADLYGWVAERYVRLFTLALDLNVGLNLTGTTVMGMPALQPMLVGIDGSSIKVRITNNDLLAEKPEVLQKVIAPLLGIAVDTLVGALKPVPLPSVQGFTLEGLQLQRVQTAQDDFLAVYAGLKLGQIGKMGLLPLHTQARIVSVDVPPAETVRRALIERESAELNEGVPALTVDLDAQLDPAQRRTGLGVEFSYRIDGGAYRPWTPQRRLVIRDAMLLLAGPHVLTVRSRLAGEIGTEDLETAQVPFTIAAQAEAGGCQVGTGRGDQGRTGLFVLLLLCGLLLRRSRMAAGLFGLLLWGCGDGNLCTTDCPGTQQALGDVGRYSSLAYISPRADVSAYNATSRSLMIGRVTPPGIISEWEPVDGNGAQDVGRYCSIGRGRAGLPVVAYYDATHHTLRFAASAASGWTSHVIDGNEGDDLGRFASLSVGRDGTPQVAYLALVPKGARGQPESQLRVARAQTAAPQGSADWIKSTVDSLPFSPPPVDPKAGPVLPEAVALFIATARRPDDGLAIAYHDRVDRTLRYVEQDPHGGKGQAPLTLAGGMPQQDDGPYPALAIDGAGTAHLSYVDTGQGALRYINTRDRVVETIDDGWRPGEETTADGLPSPVHHRVGDSSAILLKGGRIFVAYQDATWVQLRLAIKDAGTWHHQAIAGHGTGTGTGGYGFFAGLQQGPPGALLLSSYAIDQKADPPRTFVETFLQPINQ